MGLDIGIPSNGIKYLDRPDRPTYTFLWELAADPMVGLSEENLKNDHFWDGGGNEGNALYQFDRASLENRAKGWAEQEGITKTEREELLSWLADLPADTETGIVTLQLNW